MARGGLRVRAHRGVRDWLLTRRAELDPIILAAFADARAALEALRPEGLEAALVSRPADVEAAYDAIKAMQVLLTVDLAGALGVTVTFNPTDGD